MKKLITISLLLVVSMANVWAQSQKKLVHNKNHSVVVFMDPAVRGAVLVDTTNIHMDRGYQLPLLFKDLWFRARPKMEAYEALQSCAMQNKDKTYKDCIDNTTFFGFGLNLTTIFNVASKYKYSRVVLHIHGHDDDVLEAPARKIRLSIYNPDQHKFIGWYARGVIRQDSQPRWPDDWNNAGTYIVPNSSGKDDVYVSFGLEGKLISNEPDFVFTDTVTREDYMTLLEPRFELNEDKFCKVVAIRDRDLDIAIDPAIASGLYKPGDKVTFTPPKCWDDFAEDHSRYFKGWYRIEYNDFNFRDRTKDVFVSKERSFSYIVPNKPIDNDDYYLTFEARYDSKPADFDEETWTEINGVFYPTPATGIENTTETNSIVYPNPTTGIVNIDTASEIKVYNLQGTLLFTTFGTQVDLSEYPAGVYYLHINNEVTRVLKK